MTPQIWHKYGTLIVQLVQSTEMGNYYNYGNMDKTLKVFHTIDNLYSNKYICSVRLCKVP